jgi:hypothetical protein
MKKLLLVVAIATIGLTTSYSKKCSACSTKTASILGIGGIPVGTGKSVEECKALQSAADASKGTIEYNYN